MQQPKIICSVAAVDIDTVLDDEFNKEVQKQLRIHNAAHELFGLVEHFIHLTNIKASEATFEAAARVAQRVVEQLNKG